MSVLAFDWSSLLQKQPVLPLLSHIRPDQVSLLSQTFLQAGYLFVEVALRDEEAWQCLEMFRETELQAVAGSVRTSRQLAILDRMGITLAVTPGWSQVLSDEAQARGIRLLPGVATPSEALQASMAGYQQLKFFPATALGMDYLKALSAPFPELRFVPTGGLTSASVPDWCCLPSVSGVGGSWMLDRKALQQADAQLLLKQAQSALQAARKYLLGGA